MQRYFVPKDQFTLSTVKILGDDAHHLNRVLRARPKDRIIACDGEGREVLAEIVELGKNGVAARIIEELPANREPCVQVWIAQSLPKGDKMETVIQKGTEIGASRFIPFVSERTIVQYDSHKENKRLERWRKIAKEAAEQANRSRIPLVEPPHSWQQLLKLVSSADAALFCYEKEEKTMLKNALREPLRTPKVILLMIGPEGGFTEKEADDARAAGCRPVSLGRRILRTETAALVGLAGILYEFGEMGG